MRALIIVYISAFRACVVLSIMLVVAGCGNSFYSDKGGWDYSRMPLLWPYEMVYMNNEFSIGRVDGTSSILLDPVTEMGVYNEIVFGRVADRKVFDTFESGFWFILDLDTGKISKYPTKKEMTEILSKYYKITMSSVNIRKPLDFLQENNSQYVERWQRQDKVKRGRKLEKQGIEVILDSVSTQSTSSARSTGSTKHLVSARLPDAIEIIDPTTNTNRDAEQGPKK
jgi:hypothetical protein